MNIQAAQRLANTLATADADLYDAINDMLDYESYIVCLCGIVFVPTTDDTDTYDTDCWDCFIDRVRG